MDEVIGRITRAFPLQPIPAVGLYQSQAADLIFSGRMPAAEARTARARDDQRAWNEYSDDEIRTLDLAMAHQVPHGFVYFLPAYLCAALRQLHARDGEVARSMLVTDACFFVSSRSSYQLQRFALLTQAQRAAISAFLEHLVEHAEAFDSTQARKALERYWRKPDRG